MNETRNQGLALPYLHPVDAVAHRLGGTLPTPPPPTPPPPTRRAGGGALAPVCPLELTKRVGAGFWRSQPVFLTDFVLFFRRSFVHILDTNTHTSLEWGFSDRHRRSRA